MKKWQTLANADKKRRHFFQAVVNIVRNILQFVQIRNSSSFVQQSAKFIPKQLLQIKPQRKPNC